MKYTKRLEIIVELLDIAAALSLINPKPDNKKTGTNSDNNDKNKDNNKNNNEKEMIKDELKTESHWIKFSQSTTNKNKRFNILILYLSLRYVFGGGTNINSFIEDNVSAIKSILIKERKKIKGPAELQKLLINDFDINIKEINIDDIKDILKNEANIMQEISEKNSEGTFNDWLEYFFSRFTLKEKENE
jgi:hypothetical protein